MSKKKTAKAEALPTTVDVRALLEKAINAEDGNHQNIIHAFIAVVKFYNS
jgi:hypothetical protein